VTILALKTAEESMALESLERQASRRAATSDRRLRSTMP